MMKEWQRIGRSEVVVGGCSIPKPILSSLVLLPTFQGVSTVRTFHVTRRNSVVTLWTLSAARRPGHVRDDGQDGEQTRKHCQHIIQAIHEGLACGNGFCRGKFVAPTANYNTSAVLGGSTNVGIFFDENEELVCFFDPLRGHKYDDQHRG
jgi:hypothetical protein